MCVHSVWSVLPCGDWVALIIGQTPLSERTVLASDFDLIERMKAGGHVLMTRQVCSRLRRVVPPNRLSNFTKSRTSGAALKN